MGKNNSGYRRRRNTQKSDSRPDAQGGTSKKGFRAPTPGYEDDIFTAGSTKDAANFQDTLAKLSRCAGTQPWKRSDVLSKAIAMMERPVFVEPEKPVRKYYKSGTEGETTTSKYSNRQALIPVIDIIDYQNLADKYKDKK